MELKTKQYNEKIEEFKVDCCIKTLHELEEIYKSIMIKFIDDIIKNYNSLKKTVSELNNKRVLDKISKLNMLLKVLKNEDGNDGTLLGIDCNKVIMNGYIKYFYLKYRDIMLDWEISKIKGINEKALKTVVVDTSIKEDVSESVNSYLDILPEVIVMLNKINDEKLLNIVYKLNLINKLLDVYILKKDNKI